MGGLLDQPVGAELLDDLLVFDLRVLLFEIPVEQFLDRASRSLVGGDDRDELAERVRREWRNSRHRIEEERRDLGEEVVEELHEELAPADLEPDVVDLAPPP